MKETEMPEADTLVIFSIGDRRIKPLMTDEIEGPTEK